MLSRTSSKHTERSSNVCKTYIEGAPWTSVLIVVFFTLSLLLFFILVVILRGGFQRRYISTCPDSYCATSLSSGEKICGNSVKYDIRHQVCNPEFSCDNPATPFALQFSGGTRSDGVCEDGVPCRCLAFSKCPDYVAATFGGRVDPDTNIFTQNIVEIGRNPEDVGYCSVISSRISQSAPGCTFMRDVTPDSMSQCMGLGAGCIDNTVGSACINGVLAVLSDTSTPDGLDLSSSFISCVKGTSCPCGQIAVYNYAGGELACVDKNRFR